MHEEDNALERLPFVRWPLGFGLLWGVEFALFSSGSLFEPLAVSRDHNDVLTLSLIAGALVAALWAALWGKRSYPWSRFMALAGGGSLAVGLLVLDMLGSPVFLEQHGVVMALGMMMGVGMGMGWLTVLWQVRLLTRYSRYLLPFFCRRVPHRLDALLDYADCFSSDCGTACCGVDGNVGPVVRVARRLARYDANGRRSRCYSPGNEKSAIDACSPGSLRMHCAGDIYLYEFHFVFCHQ